MNALLVARAVRRVYAGGDGQLLEILRGIDMEVRRGEFVAIVGSSGRGRHLLHLLGALDGPRRRHLARRLALRRSTRNAADRNRWVRVPVSPFAAGFSALENVMMPLLIGGASPRKGALRAENTWTWASRAG
jgi:ABC-type lipoprotein export system ATPase subunit